MRYEGMLGTRVCPGSEGMRVWGYEGMRGYGTRVWGCVRGYYELQDMCDIKRKKEERGEGKERRGKGEKRRDRRDEQRREEKRRKERRIWPYHFVFIRLTFISTFTSSFGVTGAGACEAPLATAATSVPRLQRISEVRDYKYPGCKGENIPGMRQEVWISGVSMNIRGKYEYPGYNGMHIQRTEKVKKTNLSLSEVRPNSLSFVAS